MEIKIKRWLTFIDQVPGEKPGLPDLRKVAIAVVVDNPYAGRGYVEDMGPLIRTSIEVGRKMGAAAADMMKGYGVQSYGKAGLVGINGEQEHVNAMLTTSFAKRIGKFIRPWPHGAARFAHSPAPRSRCDGAQWRLCLASRYR